jgi:predicted lipase
LAQIANAPQFGATDQKIIVTGHSLGGALAALTAQQIEMDIGDRVQAVYTFGMPRPGDATLATAYNQRPGQRTYRLAYGEDLVPTVPSLLRGWLLERDPLGCEPIQAES